MEKFQSMAESKEIRLVRDFLCAGLDAVPFSVGEEAVEWSQIQKCMEAHQLMAIAWMGCRLVQDQEKIPLTFYQALKREYQVSVGWDSCQYFALEQLKKTFQQEKIDFIPLKGIVLKQDYPQSPLRHMSDLDLLFRREQFSRVRPIMDRLGCRFIARESVDEGYFWGPIVHIEAHWALMEGEDEASEYFNHIWEKAVQVEEHSCEYRISWEDYYLYMIAHAAKHFALYGTGLRNLADVHVFLRTHGNDLDWKRIQQSLVQFRLDQFEKMLRDLQEILFQKKMQLTNAQREILQYLVCSGAYGTWENGKINRAVGNNATAGKRATAIRNTMFPSKRFLQEKYPHLASKPYGVYAGWLLHTSGHIRRLPKTLRHLKQLAGLRQERFQKQKQLMKTVGLEHLL